MQCIGIFRGKRVESRLASRNPTHTCGGCGGGCSYGGRREDEKDLAIGMEKEKVDELL